MNKYIEIIIKMCSELDEFYQCFVNDLKYDILFNKIIGPFGGVARSYTFNSNNGMIKVVCDKGVNTLGYSSISIKLLGTVRSVGEHITSEGSSFLTSGMTIDKDGNSRMHNPLSISEYNFPTPIPGRSIA